MFLGNKNMIKRFEIQIVSEYSRTASTATGQCNWLAREMPLNSQIRGSLAVWPRNLQITHHIDRRFRDYPNLSIAVILISILQIKNTLNKSYSIIVTDHRLKRRHKLPEINFNFISIN